MSLIIESFICGCPWGIELLDFNVESFCKEPKWEVEENGWMMVGRLRFQLLGLILRELVVVLATIDDRPPSDDDSQDEDFVWDGEDGNDSEDVSLDK